MDNEQNQKLQERLSTEKTFEDIDKALSYAITVTKEQNEDVAIFKRKDGIFVIIHLINAELAIQCGYSIVFNSFDIYCKCFTKQ